MTTAVTAQTFTALYTEFSNPVKFPASGITYYIGLADKMLVNPLRWGNVRDDGIMLFTAHYLALEGMARQSAAAGAVPGLQTGAMSSKAVGPVSAGYNTEAGLELNAGHWNLTTYGTRFLNLARMIGSGGFQV